LSPGHYLALASGTSFAAESAGELAVRRQKCLIWAAFSADTGVPGWVADGVARRHAVRVTGTQSDLVLQRSPHRRRPCRATHRRRSPVKTLDCDTADVLDGEVTMQGFFEGLLLRWCRQHLAGAEGVVDNELPAVRAYAGYVCRAATHIDITAVGAGALE
jgi:hypothetical protein